MSKERENWKLGTRTSCKWCQGKIRAPLFDDIGPEITGAKMPENVCADQGRLCVLLLFLIGLMQKGKKKKFPFESAGWSCFRELDFVIIWIKLAGTFSRGFELNINVLLAIFFFGGYLAAPDPPGGLVSYTFLEVPSKFIAQCAVVGKATQDLICAML